MKAGRAGFRVLPDNQNRKNQDQEKSAWLNISHFIPSSLNPD